MIHIDDGDGGTWCGLNQPEDIEDEGYPVTRTFENATCPDCLREAVESNLSRRAQQYLKDVWGYNNISNMDPITASCLLENSEEESADVWPLDHELWQAYLMLHSDVPKNITFKAFQKLPLYTTFKPTHAVGADHND